MDHRISRNLMKIAAPDLSLAAQLSKLATQRVRNSLRPSKTMPTGSGPPSPG